MHLRAPAFWSNFLHPHPPFIQTFEQLFKRIIAHKWRFVKRKYEKNGVELPKKELNPERKY
jgi:hypothetical protein